MVQPDIKIEAGLNNRALSDGHWFTFPHLVKSGSFARVKVVGPIAEWNGVSRNNDVSTYFSDVMHSPPQSLTYSDCRTSSLMARTL